MFSKKKLTGESGELSNYINEFDIYNSNLLELISKSSAPKVRFTITEESYRPDLIAKKIYGSSDYLGLLMIQTGVSLDSFKKGTVLELFPKTTLDGFISSL